MPSFWKRLFGAKQPPTAPLSPLDLVLGALLETWGQRYQFDFDRAKGALVFNRRGFELRASELPTGGICLNFNEAGKQHRVECSVEEAPKVIETLLFADT